MAKKKKLSDLIPPSEKPRKLGLLAWLRSRFFAGMVIAAPMAVTFLILQFLITFIDSRVRPLLPPILKPETYTNYAIPGFGVLVLIIALTLLGAVTANLFGRSIVSFADRFLSRIPVVRNVYAALRQLTEVLANNKSASFDRVVMIQYPREGSWCLGFVSSYSKGEVKAKLGPNKIGVFVPTTPNPTSGFLMYVDPSECIEMDMTIEEGAKMILTAGLVVPDYLPNTMPSPAANPSVSETQPGSEQLIEKG